MDINKILKLRQFKALDLDVQNEEALIYGDLINTDKRCPNCSKEAIKPHQYHKRKVRTAPFNSMPTYLIFTHSAYLCPLCNRRFLEKIDFLEKDQRKTLNYFQHVYQLAKKQDLSRVAEIEGLEWETVNAIFLKGRKEEKIAFKSRPRKQAKSPKFR